MIPDLPEGMDKIKGFLADARYLIHLASAHDHFSDEIMQEVNDMYHYTTMTIIDNMGSDPVDYYDNGVYVGTW